MKFEELKLDNDILELEGIDNARKNIWLHYTDANNNPIPRVTKIIAQNQNQDYLIQWAANIGRRKYDYYREKAMDIGTIVHMIIDEYLGAKYIAKNISSFHIDYNEFDYDKKESIYSAFESFLKWEKDLNNAGYYIEEVVGLEIPVMCPWFGGTVDGIVKINGAYYIIDFKTSKQISYDYLIQASAYMWMINNGYGNNLPHINGIGIIRVNKSNIKYEDLFLNEFVPENYQFICRLIQAFLSYVDSYYRTINVQFMFDSYKYCYPTCRNNILKGETT